MVKTKIIVTKGTSLGLSPWHLAAALVYMQALLPGKNLTAVAFSHSVEYVSSHTRQQGVK